MARCHDHLPGLREVCMLLLAMGMAALWVLAPSSAQAQAQARLSEFLQAVEPSAVVPGADSFGPAAGSPPVAPALAGGELLGFVFLNSDFVDSIGYSGKPIHIVAGIDMAGRIMGVGAAWRSRSALIWR